MLFAPSGKDFAPLPLFDPMQGIVIREPRVGAEGYWAGAPSVFPDPKDGLIYLTYRLREPRPARGHLTRIAVSRDGVEFEDIFEARREDFDSPSIERCSLYRGDDGLWRWYVGLVDPQDNRWRVDILEADRPDGFDPSKTGPLFLANDLGLEGIKDPSIFVAGGLVWMLLSHGEAVPGIASEKESEKHATADIFNTGLTVSSTSRAVSADGSRFRWLGPVGPERSGWDAYCLRMTCLFPLSGGLWCAFYDGSARVEENYEERMGAAVTWDGSAFHKTSPDGPVITVPYGTGSVRYADAAFIRNRLHIYYEMARPDGGHELRVGIVT
ncbi:MAG: hypothetical protein IT210_15355 [Armatimonadetes bacterium]|nr:hypothetical protein [Armatimonadota bacterium]